MGPKGTHRTLLGGIAWGLGLASLLIFAATLPRTSGADADDRRLRIGYFPNLTHAQALCLKSNKCGQALSGANVEWTAFTAGPTAIESMMIGAIDASYVGANPAINGHLKTRGEVFRVVSGSASGGASLVVAEGVHLDRPEDMAGKILATPQLGNTQDVSARKWLESHHLAPKERGGSVTVQPIPNPDLLGLFRRGDLHAAWTVEPWVSILEEQAGARIFLEEKDLWPRGHYPTTLLVISKRLIEESPALAQKLVDAHVEATHRLSSDPNEAVEILGAALESETGKALPNKVIERAMQRIVLTTDPMETEMQMAAESAFEAGFLRSKPTTEGLFDLRFLESAQR